MGDDQNMLPVILEDTLQILKRYQITRQVWQIPHKSIIEAVIVSMVILPI